MAVTIDDVERAHGVPGRRRRARVPLNGPRSSPPAGDLSRGRTARPPRERRILGTRGRWAGRSW